MPTKTFFTTLTLFLAFITVSAASAAEVVVYSARSEHLIKPVFEAYTAKTGVKVKYITAKAGVLHQRLKAEGPRSPADLFITVDAGNLWHAAEAGLLSKADSETLLANVPAHLRDPEGRWFALSIRARTVVYNTDMVRPSELSTYEALGDDRWQGRLVLRTSKKVYNQSLVASLIADHGEGRTEEIVRSWVSNLAAPPLSNDTKVLESIAAGLGDVGVVNTYYFGRLMKEKPGLPLALFWPNQDSTGVHVNVSGAGVTAHAKNRAEAIRLLEWLSSEEAQNLFADVNMEYPVNPRVNSHATVTAWGEFRANPANVAVFGKYQAAAVRLMDRAGYR